MSNSLPLSISPQVLQNYAIFVLSRSKPMGSLTMNLHHASTGMSTEAGEALSTQTNLVEEAGDALFYIQMLCNLLGCTLLDLIAANEAKLRLRYPDGYSDQAATERADKSDTVAPWRLAQAGQEAGKAWTEYQKIEATKKTSPVAQCDEEDIDKACREN